MKVTLTKWMLQRVVGVLIFVVSGFILWYSISRVHGTEYRVFLSPDGKYKIVVYKSTEISFSMPGQGGDSPGYVILYDGSGGVLGQQNVEIVNNVDQVFWENKKVDVKLVAEWNLPE